MNRVELDILDVEAPDWLERARGFALKALDALGHRDWDLSMAFCGDGKIKELNRDYRGKDEPTDVLSFEQGDYFDDPDSGRRFLAGDIVISLDTLGENAAYFGVGKDEELKRLIVHGILHLGGMDHEDNSPEREMLARQEEILAGLAEERIL
jgi:probable rRNA maturation factor